MSGGVYERLAELVMGLPEGQREALLQRLAVPRKVDEPRPAGPERALPEQHTVCQITSAIEWV